MIVEQGTVTKVEHDAVWVHTRQKSTCGSCAARVGCGQSLLSRWMQGASEVRVRYDYINSPVTQKRTVQIGDRVEIGIQEGALVSASLLSYLFPLLGLVAGAWVGESIGSTIISVLLALIGLVACAVGVRFWQSTWQPSYFEPVLLKALPGEPVSVLP